MEKTTDLFDCGGIRSLNLGCGRRIMPGYINLDIVPMQGVDVVFDLEQCDHKRLPFEDNSFDLLLASHLLEHIKSPLPLMQELHRVTAPGGLLHVNTPHGSSDDAFEDPTHVRPIFPGTFGYFSQPYYWRADYGYRGDWAVKEMILVLKERKYMEMAQELILKDVNSLRNVVREMRTTLCAIKPTRAPKKELQIPILFHFAYDED